MWSRDGELLYFRSGRKLMSAAVRTAPNFTAERTAPVLEGDFAKGPFGLAGYDVTDDGERFVMIRERYAAGVVEVVVVLNWLSQLSQGS